MRRTDCEGGSPRVRYTTARFRHPAWRRRGRLAARGKAAAGDACGRIPQQRVARHLRAPPARISPGPEGGRLCRGRKRSDRIPVGGRSIRSVASVAATGSIAAALAAKAATTTIPIVFATGEDPVRLGLVSSLARPGGNATGINFFIYELVAKRLELLHTLVPGATRVAVLVNPANVTTTASTLRDVEAAAQAMGLQLHIFNASTSGEINATFATLTRERVDALFVGPDAMFNSRRVQIVILAARHGISTTYAQRDFV